jgi:hypothetical protein
LPWKQASHPQFHFECLDIEQGYSRVAYTYVCKIWAKSDQNWQFFKIDLDDIRVLSNIVQLLQARLSRSEMYQQQMASDLEDLKSRGMRDNVIIWFDPAEVDYTKYRVKTVLHLLAPALLM